MSSRYQTATGSNGQTFRSPNATGSLTEARSSANGRVSASDPVAIAIRTRQQQAAGIRQMVERLERLIITSRELKKVSERSFASQAIDRSLLTKGGEKADAILRRIEPLPHILEPIARRFSRDYFSVGAAGEQGSGKSTLATTIAGLPKGVIPSGSGAKAITAARIDIINVPPKEKRGLLIFHTESSLMKQRIHPIMRELSHLFSREKLPQTLDELLSLSMPETIDDDSRDAWYALRGYVENADVYRHLIGRKDETVETDAIASFLRYRDPDGDGRPEHLWRAVRRAVIYHPFLGGISKNIGVVDVPGNEYRPGLDDEIAEAVRSEADFLLLLNKPSIHRGKWRPEDAVFLKKVQGHIPEVPIRFWCGALLNHEATEEQPEDPTLDHAMELKRLVRDPEGENANTFLPINIALVANVADRKSVMENIIQPLLMDLPARVRRIDRVLLEQLQKTVDERCEGLSKLVEQMCRYYRDAFQYADEHSLHNRLVDERMKAFNAAIAELRRKTDVATDRPDEPFKELVHQVIGELEQHEPDPADLNLQKRSDETGVEEIGVAGRAMAGVRVELAAGLRQIFESRWETVEAARQQLHEALFSNLQLSRLMTQENAVSESWLEALASKLDETGGADDIATALRELNVFDGGAAQVRTAAGAIIRELDADRESLYGGEKRAAAADLAEVIRQRRKAAIQELKAKLVSDELAVAPSRAAGELARIAADHLCYRPGVDRIWDAFLYKHRETLWQEEYEDRAEAEDVKMQVDQLLAHINDELIRGTRAITA